MHVLVTGLVKADLYAERAFRGRVNRDDWVFDGVNYEAGSVVYDRFWSELPVRIGKPLGLPNMWDGEYRFHVAAEDEFETPPMMMDLEDLPGMGNKAPDIESEVDADGDADATDNG